MVVLFFACNGCGLNMYVEFDYDVGVVVDEFGLILFVGMFCFGEIGFVGGYTFLYGFIVMMVLFMICGLGG